MSNSGGEKRSILKEEERKRDINGQGSFSKFQIIEYMTHAFFLSLYPSMFDITFEVCI